MTDEQKQAVDQLHTEMIERGSMRGRHIIRWEVNDGPRDIEVVFHTDAIRRGTESPDRRRCYFQIYPDGEISTETILHLDIGVGYRQVPDINVRTMARFERTQIRFERLFADLQAQIDELKKGRASDE